MFSEGSRDQLYLPQEIGGMELVNGEDSETREIGSLRKYFAATIDVNKIFSETMPHIVAECSDLTLTYGEAIKMPMLHRTMYKIMTCEHQKNGMVISQRCQGMTSEDYLRVPDLD